MHTTVAPTPQLRRLGMLLTAVTLVAIGVATLTPQEGKPENFSLCILCGSFGGVDAVLNIFLFVPLGVGLALSGVRARRALVSMLILSAGIEVAQFFWISGRDASIGDVLTNSLGGALGFAIAHYAGSWLFPSRRAATRLALGWSIFWLSVQAVTSYAFIPSLPKSHYYGQIARTFEDLATFPGVVLAASIDTTPVRDFGFANSAEFQSELDRGAFVAALIFAAGPTTKIAPIVRVADERQREIVLLAQNHRDLVFGLQTGAAVLRLRTPLFALPDVFPAVADSARLFATDTLQLRARYTKNAVDLRVEGGTTSSRQRVSIDAGLGWTLILPTQWYIEGTDAERILSSAWIALLLIPLGYWLAFQRPGFPRIAVRSWTVCALGAIVLLAVGFIAVPRWFGFSPSPLAMWLAGVGGLLIGLALGAVSVDLKSSARLRLEERDTRVAPPQQFSEPRDGSTL